MKFLIVIIILLTFDITAAYTGEIQNFFERLSSEVILDETINSKDLVYRNGLGYKNFTDTPFTGKITGKEEGYFTGGKWDGAYISYYDTGQIELTGSYKKARKDGPWKSFRVDGHIMSEGSYKNGLKEGPWKFYHLFGINLQIWNNYKNGKKDGVYKSYWGNGNLMQRGSYQNDKPKGLWIYYDKDGIKERNKKIY